MDILGTIQAHAAAMRLPLYAVTLSAVAKADTPLMLILHWHGFRRRTVARLPGVEAPLRSVAGSALQLNERWSQVESLDAAMLRAAWSLGAWDLERANHRPWWRLNAGLNETVSCHRAFASYPDEPSDQVVMVEAPDQEALLEMAAIKGYVRWLFRPRVAGVWGEADADDATLEPDGSRTSPCPVRPLPYDRHSPGRSLYRLGTGNGLIWR